MLRCVVLSNSIQSSLWRTPIIACTPEVLAEVAEGIVGQGGLEREILPSIDAILGHCLGGTVHGGRVGVTKASDRDQAHSPDGLCHAVVIVIAECVFARLAHGAESLASAISIVVICVSNSANGRACCITATAIIDARQFSLRTGAQAVGDSGVSVVCSVPDKTRTVAHMNSHFVPLTIGLLATGMGLHVDSIIYLVREEVRTQVAVERLVRNDLLIPDEYLVGGVTIGSMDAYAQPIGVQTVAVAVYLHTIPAAGGSTKTYPPSSSAAKS